VGKLTTKCAAEFRNAVQQILQLDLHMYLFKISVLHKLTACDSTPETVVHCMD
jgi:hypothetical protein